MPQALHRLTAAAPPAGTHPLRHIGVSCGGGSEGGRRGGWRMGRKAWGGGGEVG